MIMTDDNDSSDREALIGGYKPGSIRRIKLKNFLTHSHVDFCPGPRLNMVVGANGTGKSTILNAICLGLGGEPKILGRADDLRAFIMHNESQASIEITLQGHEDDVVVLKRIIDRNKGSEKGRGRGASTFYINNEKCNIQKVRELVTSRFHIAIDNLCTFLPQDKVGAFSGFTDQERLIETEKTLPTDQWFYKTHMDLIEKEEAMEQNVNNVESIEDELKKKQREFEKIEINKRHEEQRLEAERQLDLLQKKKMWVVFENQRAQCLALKERKQQLRQQLREANAAVQPLVERHEHLLAQKKELEKLSSTADNHIQKSKKELEKQKTKFEKHDDAIENTLADLFEIDSKRDKLVKNLAEARSRLEEIQEALNSCPEDIETATTNWNNQRNRWNTVKKDFENAKREYRHCQAQYQEREEKAGMLQTKLAKFNDEGARRRERILRDMPDLGRICEFIERKRSIFRKNIFGPVAVEVTVKRSQNAAAYLEYHVPARIWKAFVVETKEDSDRLYQEIRKELGIPINILCVEGKQLDRSRIYSDAKMNVLKKEHGIIGFLDESFTAPDPVMVALQIHAGVHKVLVGNEKTQVSVNQKNLRGFLSEPDSALNQNGLQGSYVFACEGPKSYRYVQSRSRFSRKMNSTEDEVGPARMLAPGVSEEQMQQVTNELEEVHSQLNEIRPSLVQSNEHVKNMEKQAQDAHLRVEDAKKRVEHINKYKVKLERQTERVRGAEDALKTDDAAEKDNLLRGLFARLGHSLTAVRTHLEQQDVMRKQTKESAGATVQKLVINTAERAAKQAADDAKRSLQHLEQEAAQVQRTFQEKKRLLEALKAEAEEKAPIVDDHKNPLPLKEQLEELPSELVELDAAIEDAEKILKTYDANPEVMRQFERLKNEIEMIQAQLEEISNSKNAELETINKERRDWETRLENHVSKINVLFSMYMEEVGCTGEVRLTKGSQDDNDQQKSKFREWGIEILVSFRNNAKAQVLSAQRHSGGERSVSTIMYLMALQDLMTAPFRCVDEINQGLDDRNERLVFRRIVANSTGNPRSNKTDHSGQYFLITPKLLPNLTDMENEAMTALFVFNGYFNFKSPTEWNIDTIVGKKHAISSEAAGDDENAEQVPRRKSKKGRLSDN